MRNITSCVILLALLGCSSIEYQVYDSVYHYQYRTDLELYGVAEFWPTSEQFQQLRQGDCDAYAGYFSEKLSVPVTIGLLKLSDGTKVGHAWVVSGGYIVDNMGVHQGEDKRYQASYTLPNWHEAALIQQASLLHGSDARQYFSEQLAPLVSLVN